jgi:microcystin-dependent protein
MTYDPGDYRYDPPTDSPFNDIEQYVPILLAAVEDWLDLPSVWPDESVTDALGYMGDLKAWIQELSNQMFTPIGATVAYAGTTAPDGWLLCDATSYAKADYPELWGVLSLSGAYEDDADNFHTPDLRGRVVIGMDDPSAGDFPIGGEGGHNGATVEVISMPSHNHSVHGHGTAFYAAAGTVPNGTNVSTPGSNTVTGNTGGGNGFDNMPPYHALNFIIRAK